MLPTFLNTGSRGTPSAVSDHTVMLQIPQFLILLGVKSRAIKCGRVNMKVVRMDKSTSESSELYAGFSTRGIVGYRLVSFQTESYRKAKAGQGEN